MTHSGAPYGISSSSLRGSGNGLSHPTDCARSPGLSPQWDQGCGQVSSRVRGRYVQRPADAAIGGARVVIELMVRRFRCETPGLPHWISGVLRDDLPAIRAFAQGLR
ncbi:transposase family protein [Kitasatospora purpeofusca]|uniref:transposase family protein n=1 Tax=Kitasatospora purpeofusca TaxID=67352 RepID=UPI0035D64AE3